MTAGKLARLATAIQKRIRQPSREQQAPAETPVRWRSRSVNIYHCCAYKAGSQWVRRMLSDKRVYEYSGLRTHTYQQTLPERFDTRRIPERTFSEPFPERTILTPMYISYEGYQSIPKPESFTGFFVMRDPRDIAVSWYFSNRYSHPMVTDANRVARDTLEGMNFQDGMIYTIEEMAQWGVFEGLRSWVGADQKDSSVLVFRFEDLTGKDAYPLFRQLFAHCDIRLPDDVLRQLLDDFSFERLSKGRKQGEEDIMSHYRKGIPGDWQHYFDDRIAARFDEIAADVVTYLGYA